MHIGLFDRRDRERFERDVVGHVAAAYNFARWLLNDPNDAEDAVQEATMKAIRNYSSYRGGDLKSWFLAIVRSTCMNVLRSRNRRFDHEADDQELLAEIPARTPGPDEIMERKEEAERLREAIGSLPPTWRELLILREFEQMSYGELAVVADVPIGTVMSRLSRARERLREILCGEQA
jgi:RNA polymerase sigma factor (sigma-70 family)